MIPLFAESSPPGMKSLPLRFSIGDERGLANCPAIRPTFTTGEAAAYVNTTAICRNIRKKSRMLLAPCSAKLGYQLSVHDLLASGSTAAARDARDLPRYRSLTAGMPPIFSIVSCGVSVQSKVRRTRVPSPARGAALRAVERDERTPRRAACLGPAFLDW